MWQGSAQLLNLDAHLQRDRRGLLPRPGRLRFPGHPLGPERCLVIIASIRASEGKFYRYPFTIRFLN